MWLLPGTASRLVGAASNTLISYSTVTVPDQVDVA